VIHAAFALLAQAPQQPRGISGMAFMIQIVAIIAIFYFILIRPQRKEQQRHREMVQSLKKGDEVVTNGGIIGTIVRAEEDRLVLRTGGEKGSGQESRVTVERARVARRIGGDEEV